MPTPSTDTLTPAYHETQRKRIVDTLARIVRRPDPLASGFVVPSAENIAIHDGRRLEATVMFLDISGFSNRPCESADEQLVVMQILSLFFTEMIRVIEEYGGVVEKNTGDGLMAYFDGNVGNGNSIQKRAVACALTMFSAADYIINPILHRSGITPLQFRICMDHGWITVAKIGAARRFNGIVAVGTTANIASKMLSHAKPDSILLGDSMRGGLPADWVQKFSLLESVETGWKYRKTNSPYLFWRYTGRWRKPVG